MLRWMCGVGQNKEQIRGTTKVGEISENVQESRLKWYRHVMRREEEYMGKKMMDVTGQRGKGRPKQRRMDRIKYNLTERGLSGKEAQDRAA